MCENPQGVLNRSESQNIFRWDSRRNDYFLIKGVASGQYIKDLYAEYPEQITEMLDELYTDERTNQHTKKIIIEIRKYTKI